MLVKLTSENQLILPAEVIDALGHPSHVDVTVEGNRLVLIPARVESAAAVRAKLEALGLTDEDITEAVAWARSVP